MTASDITSLKARYIDAGQGHVFKFWDTLTADQQVLLAGQLEKIDPQLVSDIAQKTILSSEEQGVQTPSTIEPLPEEASDSELDCTVQQLDRWKQTGLQAISENKVAVLLLAGGQGTRLGSSDPKGCYDVGLTSHKSLFQLQAERILKISSLAATEANPNPVLPWYIMTSGPTRKATQDFFTANNYFGLDEANVKFFEQGTLPCLTRDGKIMMENKYTVAVAPDGNGGVYSALERSGILYDMEHRNIQHVHAYCVDNCLVKVADPIFIGYAMERQVDIATKVVRKRDAKESVGLIVSKNGRPAVIEYSEISAELAEAKDEAHPELLKLRAANIVNHYYSAKFLYGIRDWPSTFLPFHVASKKIPSIDMETGTLNAKPSSPNGIKLEQFVFDVFPNLTVEKFGCLEVKRSEEFSPLKNGPGAKQDCPETSRRDLLAESYRWLKEAGAILEDDAEIEVSPLTSYAGEGLEQYKGKHLASGIL